MSNPVNPAPRAKGTVRQPVILSVNKGSRGTTASCTRFFANAQNDSFTRGGVNLNRAWRRTFWQAYDNLGHLVIVSLLWILFSATIILSASSTASLFFIALFIIKGESPRLSDFFKYLYKCFLKSSVIVLILLAVLLALLLNIHFYLHHFSFLGAVLAGICFWALLFIILSSIYIFPLITRGKKLSKIISISLVLVFDNFKITLIIFLTAVILSFFSIFVPIFGIGILSIFLQNSFLELEARYNPDLKIEEPRRKIREIFRPWKLS